MPHTGLEAVVDTGRICYDQRRSVVCLCLADSLEGLGVVGTHRNLCAIYVAVCRSNQAEVFLADALACGGKLGDSAERGRLGCLTAGVRVNFGVEHDDVDVLARSEHVVETAETDVVCCAVTGDDTLRAGDQIALEFEDALADVASAGLAERHELVGDLAGDAGAVAVVEPLLCERLDFVRALVAAESGGHQVGKTVLKLLGGDLHAEAEFGEVLEERVGPCGTVAFGVGGVRCRGHRTRVDRRATRCVGNHLVIAEKLRDKLDIGSLATARACARELEERCRKLAVLGIECYIYKILLAGDFLRAVCPVFLKVELSLERFHHESLHALLAGADIDAVAAAETVEGYRRRHRR